MRATSLLTAFLVLVTAASARAEMRLSLFEPDLDMTVFESNSRFTACIIEPAAKQVHLGHVEQGQVKGHVDVRYQPTQRVRVEGNSVTVATLNADGQATAVYAAPAGEKSRVELLGDKITVFKLNDAGEPTEVKAASLAGGHRMQVVFAAPAPRN